MNNKMTLKMKSNLWHIWFKIVEILKNYSFICH